MNQYQRKGVLNFVLLGAKGTGKTVYLYNLNNRAEITALGKDTVDYLENLKHSKQIDGKIQATQIDYRELFFEYKDDDYKIDFQIDDYDGNFIETLRTEENSDYKEKLIEYIEEAEGIFVFLAYEPDANEDRFEKMKVETDTFIEKIKEIYGEDFKELPIPIIICVSKWDESPYFKSENETEKAIEYIDNNPTLKAIKDKLISRFKIVEIIPLSSEKNHNILLPIKKSLDYTFNMWEEKIKTLSENNKKEELLIFLSERLYDLKFYKDGKYINLYNNIENEYSQKILDELENITSIKAFNEFYEQNKNIIESLNEEHQNIIFKKEAELKKKNLFKQIIIGSSVICILTLGVWGYSKYQTTQAENKLYSTIMTEYKSNNLLAVLNDSKKYYSIYPKENKIHFTEIKKIEEQTKEKLREQIDSQLDNLENITSLLKKYQLISNINLELEKYGIESAKKEILNKELETITADKKLYDEVLEKISSLSLDSLDKDTITFIYTSINQLSNYDESKILHDNLIQKINTIINASKTTDNISIIQTLLDMASTINLSQDQIDILNQRLQELELLSQIQNFIDEVKNQDNISNALDYVIINWKDDYGESTKIELTKILKTQFSEYIQNQLNNFPNSINNIDDYKRGWSIIDDIVNVAKKFKTLPIAINLELDNDAKTRYDDDVKLLSKYSNILKNGVTTSKLILIAPKNNALGFNTSDDEIYIYVDNVPSYEYSESAHYKNGNYIINLFNSIKYYPRSYSFRVKEENVNIGSFNKSRYESGNVEITPNDLIKLYNQGWIQLEISGTDLTIQLVR